MESGLNDRVAVVTGGSSGIGLETARQFLGEGAKVAICGRNRERLDAAAKALAAIGGADRVLAVPCDVLVESEVAAFRAAVENRFGGADVLINNAGEGRVSNFANTTDEAWRAELNLKFFSFIYPTRAFIPLLEQSRSGAIVCVNSLISIQPEPHMVATCAARGGVLTLAKALATELAPKGVRVNTILLGLIDSGQWARRYETQERPKGITKEQYFADLARARHIPLGRLGRPEEPARAIVFLGSPLASYITGTTLEICGGQSRHV